MNIIHKLKDWVTLTEAASHIAEETGVEVGEADLLALAVGGKLKLSARFTGADTYGAVAGTTLDPQDSDFDPDRRFATEIIEEDTHLIWGDLNGVFDLRLGTPSAILLTADGDIKSQTLGLEFEASDVRRVVRLPSKALPKSAEWVMRPVNVLGFCEQLKQHQVVVKPRVEQSEQQQVVVKPRVEQSEQQQVVVKPQVEQSEQQQVVVKPRVEQSEQQQVVVKPRVEQSERHQVAVKPQVEQSGQVEQVEQPLTAHKPPNLLAIAALAEIATDGKGKEYTQERAISKFVDRHGRDIKKLSPSTAQKVFSVANKALAEPSTAPLHMLVIAELLKIVKDKDRRCSDQSSLIDAILDNHSHPGMDKDTLEEMFSNASRSLAEARAAQD